MPNNQKSCDNNRNFFGLFYVYLILQKPKFNNVKLLTKHFNIDKIKMKFETIL